LAPSTSTARAVLHGQDLAYREYAGRGPLLLLVHGVGSSSATWDPVLPGLGDAGAAVVTLDLPGHGESAKERGDYSLGALASTVRDLLDHLGHQTCVFVGHSLGGGIAMQFAYQFPERCQALVLVASGGLGREASPLLRAASLPGAELVLPLVAHPRTVSAVASVGRVLSLLRGTPESADLLGEEALTTLRSLQDPASRAAFLATLRGVMDISGQRVSAVSKLPSASHLPTLLVWGDRDPIIPVEHGRRAVELLPRGRLVIFPGAGHEPHRHDPTRFAELLLEHRAVAAASDNQPAQAGKGKAATSAAARSPVRKAPSISPLHGPAVHSPASTTRPTTRAAASSSTGSPPGQAPSKG
jgi:pimeloyl-ACP methyl ester carboxylesterase